MSVIATERSYGMQLDPKTAEVLHRFHRRRRTLLTLRGVAAALVVFLLAILLVALCDYLWLLSDPLRWSLSAIAYALSGVACWWFGWRPSTADAIQTARQLESTDPRLREDLLSAVELSDPNSANGSTSFRSRLQEIVANRVAEIDVRRLLPIRLVRRWLMLSLIFGLAFAALLFIPRVQFGRRIARAMLPILPIQRASLTDLSILKPSPASSYVAEGDAVGVLVQLGGRLVDDVKLQWRNADGIEGESMMTPRATSTSADNSVVLDPQSLFAANLSVGNLPLQYRVVAGDAITLWHELTPLPRPRVLSFRKQLQFPSFAKLEDRIEEAEHGDLKALVGTKALVTVRFDEPVERATIRFGNRGQSITLDPIDGSETEYLVAIPIRTPGTYQVDAHSRRSGLNNPFSPQYTITPVPDTPPIVRWSANIPNTKIVSPLDVVSLVATATDDLPIDRVVQEFQINGDPVQVRDLEVPASDRELDLQWDWDLMRRNDEEKAEANQSIKLSSGDIVRTRVVAIDRNSQRGESRLLELLITDEGFDSERHAKLDQLKQLTAQVTDWSQRMNRWFDATAGMIEQSKFEEIDRQADDAKVLQEESEAVLKLLMQVAASSTTLPEAGALELIGRAVSDLTEDQRHWLGNLQQARLEDHEAWRPQRETILRDHAQLAKQYAADALRLDQFARYHFVEAYSLELVSDVMSLRRSLAPLLDQESSLPLERFPRYLVVTVGRLREIDQWMDDLVSVLPESTRNHTTNWLSWSESRQATLQQAIKEPPAEEPFRNLVKQFDADIANVIQHSLVETSSPIQALLRELRMQIGPGSDLVRWMARHGQEIDQAINEQKNQTDSSISARIHWDQRYSQDGFVRAKDHLLHRLEQDEALHRSRPTVDLQFAADAKLMQRAMENVATDGYAPYRDEPAPTVYQNLAMAWQILEAKHEADQWLGEIQQLMLAERRLDDPAAAKVSHPNWLERFGAGVEWPARTLQNAGIPWEEIEGIDRSRYNEDFNQARSRITGRRWSSDPLLSAESTLDSLQQDLSRSLDALEPRVLEARATLERYVLSLSEQAREAASLARETQQHVESRTDSTPDTVDQLAEEQDRAADATEQTLESLVDLANTASLTDANERELARDADAAAAQIQQSAKQAQDAMDRATKAGSESQRREALDQSSGALEQLADALQRTADHFEKAERGEDVSESRRELRQSESSLEQSADLQDRYQQAEELADAAQSSPEEMMRQLEEQLQDNQPMRQELSEIARRAAENAQRSLDQSAREETGLSQSLERSDPGFQERKQRAARELSNLGKRASSVEQSLLQAADQAIGWANAPELKPDLDKVRESLRSVMETANRLPGDQAPLAEIQSTAATMSEAIRNSLEMIPKLEEQVASTQDRDVHKDETSRQRTGDQLDRIARHARSLQLRDTNQQRQYWNQNKQEASRRVEDAQRQKQDAERQQQQLRERLEREPQQAPSLNQEIANADQRIAQANAAEQAARESKDFAEKRAADTESRENAIKSRGFDPFDKPNPASQLAIRMGQEANQELQQISNALNELSQQLNFADQLRAPGNQSQQIAQQQQRIEREVGEAAADLRRAARHEQRLGKEELSQQLDAVAEAVEQKAEAAMRQAGETLQQAASQAEASPQANQRISSAADETAKVADQLAQMLASEMPQSEQAAASESPSQDSEQQGQQLAQTLDELDRQLAGSRPSSRQSAGSEQAASEEGQGEPESRQPSTAQQASPTLAGAVDAQSQQAARQRDQQIHPQQGQPGNAPGSPANQSESKGSAAESGSGKMSGDGSVDTAGIDRMGREWGQLREQRSEDVSEGPGTVIAPQYRREIEAYFRAIARQAAEKQQ